jgi:hypothetical protein
MNHVTLTPNEPWAALDAPVSEIILFNLREGTDKKEFVDVLDEFIDKDVHTPGVFSGGWGPIEEDERKFGVLLGWNQVEVLGFCLRAGLWKLSDICLICRISRLT